MLLSIGYAVYFVSHLLRRKRRREMFRGAIAGVTQACSFMVQRSPQGFNQLLRSVGSQNVQMKIDTLHVLDNGINLSTVTPKVAINLDDWTLYYALKKHEHTEGGKENMRVLLEASRPEDITEFLEHEFSVPAQRKVHAASHGTAVAWRTGPPFGILMNCSQEEFITLCLAYCDGALTLDEDLAVQRIISVNTEGSAASLVPQQQNLDKMTEIPEQGEELSPPITKESVHTALLKSQQKRLKDNVSCDWSNESLASGTSIGNSADFLDMTDVARSGYSASDGGDLSVQGDDVESGCGEAPCEIDSSFQYIWDSKVEGGMKPPNVLIYSGKKDSQRKFASAKAALEQSLNLDSYVIYPLKHSQVTSVPWIDNTVLLVITTNSLRDGVIETFLKYFESGGKVLSFGSQFDSIFVARHDRKTEMGVVKMSYKTWTDVFMMSSQFCYNLKEVTGENVSLSVLGMDSDRNAVIVDVKQKHQQGHAILSQVLLERDPTDYAESDEAFNALKQSNPVRFEIIRSLLCEMGISTDNASVPELTPCFLLTRSKLLLSSFLKSIDSRLKEDGVLKSPTVSLQFVKKYLIQDGPAITESQLPVVYERSAEGQVEYFSGEVYWENLTSKVLGNTMFVTDVLPTTMPLFDSLLFSVPYEVGLIAVAGRQTKGRGRGGNAWISPVGGASFSLHVRLPIDSPLGKHASFLQHITALGVVQSVRTLPGYEDIDLRLKWPNDIYYSNKMKLGGVIVKSTVMEQTLHANIGCGFNVSNKNPTICINDLIERHNMQHEASLKTCNTSQLIARTVSIMEQLIEEFQSNGSKKFLELYYKRWLHSNTRVHLEQEQQDVNILGLDDYGFLEVATDKGAKLSVQPDGNSFDMMRNLITLKSN